MFEHIKTAMARVQAVPPVYMALLYAATLSVIPMLCIYATFGFAAQVYEHGDSPGYIYFSAVRNSFYPLFIAALGGDVQQVVYAQCVVYTATLLWLIYALHRRFESHIVTVVFGLAATGNLFMWYHHTSIMTESLTRSGMNVLVVALLYMTDKRRDDYLKWVALAGVAVGVMAGLRPAMWALAPMMLATVVLLTMWGGGGKRRIVSSTAVLAAAIACMAALEAAGYYAKHDERSSLLPRHLFAKAAMLTTEPGFTMPPLSPRLTRALEHTAAVMRPVGDWLQDDAVSPLMKADLHATFETFAITTRMDSSLSKRTGIRLSQADRKQLGIAAIKENPWLFIKMTLWQYASMWTEGATAYALTRQGGQLPVFGVAFLDKEVPHAFWRQPATISQALIVAPFFVLHGVVFLLLSLWAVWAWRRVFVGRQSLQSMPAEVMLITIALALAQGSLIMFGFTAPQLLRYLMPLLPLFMLAAALWLRVMGCAIFERWRGVRSSP